MAKRRIYVHRGIRSFAEIEAGLPFEFGGAVISDYTVEERRTTLQGDLRAVVVTFDDGKPEEAAQPKAARSAAPEKVEGLRTSDRKVGGE